MSSVTGQHVNASTSTLMAEKTRDLSLQLQPSPQAENIQWNIHKTLKPQPKVTYKSKSIENAYKKISLLKTSNLDIFHL